MEMPNAKEWMHVRKRVNTSCIGLYPTCIFLGKNLGIIIRRTFIKCNKYEVIKGT